MIIIFQWGRKRFALLYRVKKIFLMWLLATPNLKWQIKKTKYNKIQFSLLLNVVSFRKIVCSHIWRCISPIFQLQPYLRKSDHNRHGRENALECIVECLIYLHCITPITFNWTSRSVQVFYFIYHLHPLMSKTTTRMWTIFLFKPV